MKFLRRLFLLCFLAAVAFGSWKYRDQISVFYHRHFTTKESVEIKPDPERYRALIKELERERRLLEGRYATARTPQEIKQVKKEARVILERELPKLMRCWLGTPWDFNGTAQEPGSGKIACGYFVSTIMRDAGFKIERIRLAQQPSQNIIATFLPKKHMHIRVGKNYDDYLAELISRGAGIHIVGLDRHVAFLVVNPQEGVRFIHSSRSSAKSVVDESRDHAYALKGSNYRVNGNITANDRVLHAWLTRTPFATKR